MPPKRKQAIQRPKQAPWTVVHADDVTNLKYPPTGSWFDEQHARNCAIPAHPEHRWVALPVEDLARYGKPGASIWDVEKAKEQEQVDEPEANTEEAGE